MICERCGHDMAESASICPACGTATSIARASAQPPTSYGGQFPYKDVKNASSPQQHEARRQPDNPPLPVQNVRYMSSHATTSGYIPAYRNRQSPNTTGTGTGKKENALIVEILLSMVGVFGVGWLMAGETTIGAILLVCSIFVYWPLMIFGTIYTYAIGLLCLGPLAIFLIILNAIVFNQRIMRHQRYPGTNQQRPTQNQ